MLKLFASDVDGTLLNRGETELSEAVKRSVSELLASGIAFAAVSGRDVFSLRRLFSFAENDVYLAACSGALCVKGEHTLFCRPVSAESVRRALKHSRESGENAVFSAESAQYVHGSAEFFDHINEISGGSAVRINSLPEIKGLVCKISFFSPNSVLGFAETPSELRVCNEGGGWKEYIRCIAGKSAAISEIQSRIGASRSDTAAAGNESSDRGMLLRAGCRFAADDTLAEETDASRFHSPGELCVYISEIMRLSSR